MSSIKIAVVASLLVVATVAPALATKGRIITGVDAKSCVSVYNGKPMEGNRCMVSYEQ